MCRPIRPIICPPKCVFHDSYIKREVPVIHPIVNVNRQHIVNVPRHIYQPVTRNVVVDPGYMDPSQCHMDPSQNYMNPSHSHRNHSHGCNRCR